MQCHKLSSCKYAVFVFSSVHVALFTCIPFKKYIQILRSAYSPNCPKLQSDMSFYSCRSRALCNVYKRLRNWTYSQYKQRSEKMTMMQFYYEMKSHKNNHPSLGLSCCVYTKQRPPVAGKLQFTQCPLEAGYRSTRNSHSHQARRADFYSRTYLQPGSKMTSVQVAGMIL